METAQVASRRAVALVSVSVSVSAAVSVGVVATFLCGPEASGQLLGVYGGGACLFDGRTRAPLYLFESQRSEDQLGASVALVGDVNGDGFDDVVIGAPGEADGAGSATLYGGNDLFLDASPNFVSEGEDLARTLRVGVPGNPGILVLTAFDSTPYFLILGGLRKFDGTGSIVDSISVQPGLAGHTASYTGFAIDGRSRIVASAEEVVRF